MRQGRAVTAARIKRQPPYQNPPMRRRGSIMIEEVLEKASRSVEQAEGFYLDAESTTVGFENNRLKHLQSGQTKGLALRVVKDGRIGFASTSDLRNPGSL